MSASDVVGARIRELRNARGLSAEELAERCAEAAAPNVTRNGIYFIESGRCKDGRRTRMVTVDELLGLARALNVSPAVLLPELLAEPGDTNAYRSGNHNPRNIYRAGTRRDTDEHVAVAFTPEMGRLIVEALNNQRTETP